MKDSAATKGYSARIRSGRKFEGHTSDWDTRGFDSLAARIAPQRKDRMATISLSYENTFLVFDNVTSVLIGEISLMSDGWAAYLAGPTGKMTKKRVGTYATAELAIRAVDEKKPSLKDLLAVA